MIDQVKTEWLWRRQLEQHEILRKMSSLIHLFARPWWSRTWTIQEVALASNVLFVCGSRDITWSTFRCFIIAWMDIGRITPYKNLSGL